MRWSRSVAVVVTLAVAVHATTAVAGFAAAQQADVAISGVNVSPEDPAPGEKFTVTANLSNLASSNDTVTVTDVYVRDGAEEYARVSDPGSITSGNTMSVPLSFSLPESGARNLRVHATVELPGGGHEQLEYPVLVTVSRPADLLVSIPASTASVGEETPVNVTVANGDSSVVSSVEVRLSGDGTAVDPRQITGSIEPGVDETFQYDVTFEERGTRTVNATVTYVTSQGVTRTITESGAFDVGNESAASGRQVEGRIQLVGVESSGSGVVTIQGDAANVGGTNVGSVLLSVKETDSVSPMGSSGEFFVGAVNASAFDTFELIARTTDEATAVPVSIGYIVDGERRTDTVRVNVSSSGRTADPGPRNDRIPDTPAVRTPPGERSSGVLGGIGALVVPLFVVAVAGVGYYGWKRR